MSSMISAGSGALLKHRSFLLFLLSRSFSRLSSQMAAVAIGWQIYDMTGSAFDLGMVGLVQFLPTALLVFVAGHAADRYERKRVMQLCQLVQALTAVFLRMGRLCRFADGAADLRSQPACWERPPRSRSPVVAALLPSIVPQGTLQRATALSTGAAQIATITGPALGGLAYAGYAQHALRHHGLDVAVGRDPDRRGASVAARCRQGCGHAGGPVRRRQVRPQQSRHSRRPSRSTCLPYCSAAPPRCCRSMPQPGRIRMFQAVIVSSSN